jgi:hypothetical protein
MVQVIRHVATPSFMFAFGEARPMPRAVATCRNAENRRLGPPPVEVELSFN